MAIFDVVRARKGPYDEDLIECSLSDSGSIVELELFDRKKFPVISWHDVEDPVERELHLEPDEIIKLVSHDGRCFYEGIQHVEALLMLADIIKQGVDPSRILLVNLDEHHDIYSPYDPAVEGFTLAKDENWIVAARKFGWFSNESRRHLHPALGDGVVWIRRGLYDPENTVPYPEMMGQIYPEMGFEDIITHFGVRTDIKVTNVDFDKLVNLGDQVKDFVSTARKHGYYIVFSIDLDAGNNAQEYINNYYYRHYGFRFDPLNERDLAGNPLIAYLAENADSLMVFHSPSYCPSVFARKQALAFRRVFAGN